MAKVKLGDVARESKLSYKGDKSGMKIVGLEHLTTENITLSNWAEDVENTFTKSFKKGQVLFGRRRAYLKKAVVAPFDGICSGDITVIEAIPGKINADLLPFIIQNDNLFAYAVEYSAGSLSPRVKWEYLKDYEFDLPDMAEQERLATILWAAEDVKQKCSSVVEKLELYKNIYIAKNLSSCFNENGYPFEQLSSFISRGKSLKYVEQSDYYVFNQKANQSTGIAYEYLKNINGKLFDSISANYKVQKGDILINSTGTGTLGRCSYIFDWDIDCVVDSHVTIMRAITKIVNPIFLTYALNSKKGQDIIYSECVNGSTNQVELSKERFKNIKFAAIDIGEQNTHVEQLMQIEKQIAALKNEYYSIHMIQNKILNRQRRDNLV